MQTLKEFREAKGMSQTDVARALDVTTVAVSRWECGKSNALGKYRERMSVLYDVPKAEIDACFPQEHPRRRFRKRAMDELLSDEPAKPTQ